MSRAAARLSDAREDEETEDLREFVLDWLDRLDLREVWEGFFERGSGMTDASSASACAMRRMLSAMVYGFRGRGVSSRLLTYREKLESRACGGGMRERESKGGVKLTGTSSRVLSVLRNLSDDRS